MTLYNTYNPWGLGSRVAEGHLLVCFFEVYGKPQKRAVRVPENSGILFVSIKCGSLDDMRWHAMRLCLQQRGTTRSCEEKVLQEGKGRASLSGSWCTDSHTVMRKRKRCVCIYIYVHTHENNYSPF